jgi:hypothetical protein
MTEPRALSISAAGDFASGGAGGSSFVGGPGVTSGRTVAGSGTKTGGKDDPLYQSPVGDVDHHGQVVLRWTEFTVASGGPPGVELRRGGPVGYPKVQVKADMKFAPVSVSVALPASRNLLFGTQTLADYQLPVYDAAGQTTPYMGKLSEDGTTLVFSEVDLGLPGTSVMWVAAAAGHDAPLGATSLAFTVGGKTCPSTSSREDEALPPPSAGQTRSRSSSGGRWLT